MSSSGASSTAPTLDTKHPAVAEPDAATRSTTKQDVPLDFFDKPGTEELSRRLSRTVSNNTTTSTRTQDPTAEDFDYKTHLRHTLRRGEKEGVLHRELGVSFEHLTVTGDGSGLAYAPTLGEILTAPARIVSTIKAGRHPATKTILNDFTGSVRPKEMLLVLGRPGAGCSSLLKVLSNNVESFHPIEGEVSYDGASPAEMKRSHAGDIAYLPENDLHLPSLTVGETLDFAAASRTPASGARLGTREDAIRETRDVLVTLFGLRHTLNTKVGNDIVRGVSGGERKRVSIAEMMTTGCKVACHDNSTRGLDASTALEYTRALRIATDVLSLTTILSIYQCGEQIYTCFDKVCVLYDGEMVYFGPMGEAVEYFISMGYEPQNRQTSADFLVAVTDPNGRFVREGFEKSVPRTASEFAQRFRESKLGQANVARVQADKAAYNPEHLERFRASAQAEHAKHISPTSSYLISYPMQIRLAMRRRFQMQMGELPALIIVTVAAMFQALIIGSVYFQSPKNTGGFFSRGGVIFFAILYNSFTGMAEITTSYTARPVIVRQRQFAMIRPSADILALNIVDSPFKLVSIFFFDLILYFMVGLQPSASQFFIFVLFTYVTNLAMLALFRALASSNRREANATTVAGILILVVAIYVGYTIPRPSMKPWFRWLSYAQPVSFAFEALLANEFRTLDVPCVALVPSGPAYPNISIVNQVCSVLGAQPATLIVSGSNYILLSFGYTYANVWRNFGIIWAYLFFFLGVNAITTEYQLDESSTGAVMIFKRGAVADLDAAITGADEEKASKGAETFEAMKAAISARGHAADKIVPSTDIFTWRDVKYDVQIKGTTRRLLNNVSGYVVPGRMTALMGESGAGKTTLLNVLAQRTNVGVVSGDMLVNGNPLPASFQRQTGYCQQQDTHMATATVREALTFSALLRQPASTSKLEKLAYVEEVIQLLEMEAYAEAIVGEVGMGLNVEQRKRLTIGVELAAKPALLIFLDEPTSGLDSQSSWSILQLLRKLADHGQAILATIHQPSSELFQVFDRLLLLKKGGETVYFGELGEHSTTMIDYFHARTELRCDPTDNPAEFILEAIGAGASSKATLDWHALWCESAEFRETQTQIDLYHSQFKGKESAADATADSKLSFAASFSTQFKAVIVRAFQNYWRDPTYIMAKIMLNIVAGLFIGFSFYKSPDNVAGLQNKLFAVFMAVVLAAPLSQQLQPKFIGLRVLYQARERPAAMYSWPVLVLSSIVVEIPFNLFAGTLFYCCWYFTVGFPYETSRAAYAYLMYMLFQLYYATFAQFVAAMAPTAMLASILFSTFFSFVIIFNGVVQPVQQLPYFWRAWMYHLTPFTYLIEGLTVNALGGVAIACTDSQFNFLTPPSGQDCLAFLEPYTTQGAGYAQVVNGQCGYCAFATGDQFLSTLGMSFGNRYRDVGFMCAYILFNVSLVFILTYLFQILDWGSVSLFQRKAKPATGSDTEASLEEKSL